MQTRTPKPPASLTRKEILGALRHPQAREIFTPLIDRVSRILAKYDIGEAKEPERKTA